MALVEAMSGGFDERVTHPTLLTEFGIIRNQKFKASSRIRP
jgi:hypothetical protein